MTKPLFADFLEDEQAYRAAEQFWQDLQQEIVRAVDASDDWRRYQPLYFGDGKTVMTPGNPIWDARSDTLGRAFRIIQHAPASDIPEIAAWVERYEDDIYTGSAFPAIELVIALSLSEETAEIAREILERWMSETSTVGETEALIKTRLGPIP